MITIHLSKIITISQTEACCIFYTVYLKITDVVSSPDVTLPLIDSPICPVSDLMFAFCSSVSAPDDTESAPNCSVNKNIEDVATNDPKGNIYKTVLTFPLNAMMVDEKTCQYCK